MAVHVPLSRGGAGRGADPDALGEQHPLAGVGPPARDADPGHGARASTTSPTRDKDFDELDGRRQLDPRPKRFRTEEEVEFAIEAKQIGHPGADRVPVRGRARPHDAGPRDLQRGGRPGAGRAARRAQRRVSTYYDFINRTLSKKELGDFISTLVDAYGAHAVAPVLDTIKDLGFRYGTKAGVTISKNDIVIPPEQGEDPRRVRRARGGGRAAYDQGLITEAERHETIVNIWTEATDEVAAAMDRQPGRAEPDLHDGQLGCPRLVHAAPSARRDARTDGESEGRDHRAPDQGQLHGGPVGARVLHLDPRRPQGPRGHRAAHRRLGLPDAASRRRLAGRDHPREGLRDEGLRRAAALPAGRPEQALLGRAHRRRDVYKPLAIRQAGQDVVAERGEEINAAPARELEAERSARSSRCPFARC